MNKLRLKEKEKTALEICQAFLFDKILEGEYIIPRGEVLQMKNVKIKMQNY